jgi:hypothetical protein
MRKGVVLTDSIRDQIEHLATTMQKPTASKIARKLSLKCGTVYWFMLTRGLVNKKPSSYSQKPYVRNGRAINPYTPEHDELLLSMRVEGKTFREIALVLTARFGVPRTAHSIQTHIVLLTAVDDDPAIAPSQHTQQISAP